MFSLLFDFIPDFTWHFPSLSEGPFASYFEIDKIDYISYGLAQVNHFSSLVISLHKWFRLLNVCLNFKISTTYKTGSLIESYAPFWQ